MLFSHILSHIIGSGSPFSRQVPSLRKRVLKAYMQVIEEKSTVSENISHNKLKRILLLQNPIRRIFSDSHKRHLSFTSCSKQRLSVYINHAKMWVIKWTCPHSILPNSINSILQPSRRKPMSKRNNFSTLNLLECI